MEFEHFLKPLLQRHDEDFFEDEEESFQWQVEDREQLDFTEFKAIVKIEPIFFKPDPIPLQFTRSYYGTTHGVLTQPSNTQLIARLFIQLQPFEGPLFFLQNTLLDIEFETTLPPSINVAVNERHIFSISGDNREPIWAFGGSYEGGLDHIAPLFFKITDLSEEEGLLLENNAKATFISVSETLHNTNFFTQLQNPKNLIRPFFDVDSIPFHNLEQYILEGGLKVVAIPKCLLLTLQDHHHSSLHSMKKEASALNEWSRTSGITPFVYSSTQIHHEKNSDHFIVNFKISPHRHLELVSRSHI